MFGILNGNANLFEYENSLKLLSKLLFKYFNKKPIILIDEYDQGIISSFVNNYFDEGKTFFRNFFSSILKDNEYIEKAILTGILMITKESIFSGLNNLKVDSIIDNKYDNFGLDESEVVVLLKYYDLNNNIIDLKNWYNGYNFGNKLKYNPWSIINFVDNKKLKPYWVNTSSNDLIKKSLINLSKDNYNDLISLIQNNFVRTKIEENIPLERLDNETAIWNLMLFSGYLTVMENKELRFVNREVRDFYIDSFKELAGSDITKFNKLFDK